MTTEKPLNEEIEVLTQYFDVMIPIKQFNPDDEGFGKFVPVPKLIYAVERLKERNNQMKEETGYSLKFDDIFGDLK